MEAVQFRQRGTVTFPAALRQKYNIKAGDTYRIVDLDGIFVWTPMMPMVPELAREIEEMRIKSGYTMEELFASLREEREKYYAETYD